MNSTSLNRLVEAVTTGGYDIAPTYAEYIQVAFALATDCGEEGRDVFVRLCQPSPKFNAVHADRLYTNALRTGNRTVHLNTVYYLARQAGVDISTLQEPQETPKEVSRFQGFTPDFSTQVRVPIYSGEENAGTAETKTPLFHEGSEPYCHLPLLLQGYSWPAPIGGMLSYADTPEQRDILLLAAFTTIGATLGRLVRCLYSHRWFSPCLQLFVVAPPASGKGVLAWTRKLVEPLHNEIRARVGKAQEAYRQEMAAYQALGREKAQHELPQEPRNSLFIIPGNNTGTGILQNLIDSEGTGIIFETEADTIATAIAGDYGHWSDTLRNAFDHTGMAYNRRTDREYREVGSTYLSLLISGTPAQVAPLIPSAENGLFSREIFYYMPQVEEWMDQFGPEEVDADREFTRIGGQWRQTLEELRQRGRITLCLNRSQRKEFNSRFEQLFVRTKVSNGQEMNSAVVRLAVNLLRFMEVTATLRAVEQPALLTPDRSVVADNLKDGIVTRWQLSITDADFQAVMALAEPLYLHATHILSFLPATEVKNRSLPDRDRLLSHLPEAFTWQQWKEEAEHLHIPIGTAKTWLSRLVAGSLLARGQVQGSYQKHLS